MVKRTIERSRAYRELYTEVGVRAELLTPSLESLQQLPVLSKQDLFERFDLKALLPESLPPRELAGILTSSGHGGTNFSFGVSSWREKSRLPFDVDLGLEHAFGTDRCSTLLVNCLPMGVVFESRSVCVANVSVREDMACAILRQAGPEFDQCILVVDPLFAKRLLDYAADIQMDWAALRLNVILGEETFSEEFRSYLASAVGVHLEVPNLLRIGSSMGVGELGLNLFFETAETVALRRALHNANPDALLPTFFCYNPLRSFVEIVDTNEAGIGDLVITMLDANALIPMIRYRTGDLARAVDSTDMAALDSNARKALEGLPFPIIALIGKAQEETSTGEWSVERCKALLYRDKRLARCVSGAFVIRCVDGGTRWEIQLRPSADNVTDALTSGFQALVNTVAENLGCAPPQVGVWRYETFPWGMGVDHERKFRYRVNDS